MQFDPLDNKFREAAQNHHPAYDEKAWSNMEKLLDKHLPKEDKKRRFFFFWIPGIALIITTLLIIQPWKSNKSVTSKQQVQSSTQKQPEISATSDKPLAGKEQSPENNIVIADPAITVNPLIANSNQRPDILLKQEYTSILRTTPAQTRNQKILSKSDKNTNTPINLNQVNNPDQENVSGKQPTNPNNSNYAITKPGPTKLIAAANDPVSQKETVNINPVENQKTPIKEKSRSKKTHSFFFTLGGGPDMSFIRLNNTGSFKLFGGGGVGYTYNNRISLRAGVYSGRKIYTANPVDYNAPAEFYTYYPYLQKVDADCQVIEMPIAVSYHFARSSHQNFFASAGVSSYFMKTETYKYYYKTSPTSQTMTRDRTIKDVNRHYFAGLTLSAGYTRNLTKNLSLTVEPYTKLPIKGIGYGKVKLNSAGILFSLGIKPFASKNK